MTNALTRWNPLRELDDFQSRILSAFNPTLSRWGNRGDGDGDGSALWMPLVDITEDDKEYLITAELPEVKKEDVKVTLENGVLTISGEPSSRRKRRKRGIIAWSVPMAASRAASPCRPTAMRRR